MSNRDKENKRILIVLPFFADGGMERVVINLAKGLLSHKLEVSFILFRKGYGSLIEEIPKEVKVLEFNTKNLVLLLFKTVRYLGKEKPLAVLALSTRVNIICIFAKFLSATRTKLIVSTHITLKKVANTTKIKAILRSVIYRIYNFADYVHVVSKGIASDLESLGVKKEKIKVIYNPIISPEIEDRSEEPVTHAWFQKKAGGTPVILGVGRLVPQKSFQTLLKAFALVRKEKNARLAILGEGEGKNMLENLAKELGVEKDFVLLGFSNNPYSYIKHADLFVLSSAWEGFGNVLAEALAFGVPVVSTDSPHGPAEILEQGKFGKLVSVGDEKALAVAILLTLQSPLPTEVLKKSAERFTISKITQQYMDLMGVKK